MAIKVLPPDRVADAGRKQRFVQEAKAASAFNHLDLRRTARQGAGGSCCPGLRVDRGASTISTGPRVKHGLQFFDFATGKSTTVADGRTILYSRTDSSVDDLMLVENFR